MNGGDININSGIFQGDYLSPIWFSVALIPLSKLLNNTGYSYKIHDNTINILFYMEDLKLFEGLLNIVRQYSDNILTEFGLDKCVKATFFHGRFLKAKKIDLDTAKVTNIWGN